MSDITHLLQAVEQGDPMASEQLLPLVYQELRRLAAARLAREPHQTLQPTALVHEAWLKLGGADQSWKGKGHFFGAASLAMRRILVDRARQRARQRHGGGLRRIQLDAVELAITTDEETILDLNDALERLEQEAPEKARLVNLRFFSGLTLRESAAALDISLATAKRHWAYARAWLLCELDGQPRPPDGTPSGD